MTGLRLCTRLGCWATAVAAVVALGSARAEDPADLIQQRELQKQIQADTDKTVRQLETTLRVLQYYQLDKGAEKELLAEAASTLKKLSRNQMTEVIARLEAAGKAPDPKAADSEKEKAYARHREIIEELKGLIDRRDAISSLEQAADRLEKTAGDQTDLYLTSS